MQNNIVNLVNEAVSINSSLLTKSVSQSVDSGQKFVQQASDQAAGWLNIKTFDDYVVSQKSWNNFVVGETQNSAKNIFDICSEAYDAHIALWNKAVAPVSKISEAKVVKAKAA